MSYKILKMAVNQLAAKPASRLLLAKVLENKILLNTMSSVLKTVMKLETRRRKLRGKELVTNVSLALRSFSLSKLMVTSTAPCRKKFFLLNVKPRITEFWKT